ncbi:YjbH domain-containing protein [Rhodobacter ferrooxidans]|uniref:Lipoprotein n=1 Tax=Rhodobacter ferrooxidans TaxID=371731 RepID=C8S240_9RHOB|nr:YjbH domain-containing protein [Rhodobacter sp. SW2]EEW24912.1 protein of unknown function DUF940 membrane lipoprotein putative [Rhodobacter sp. SW2]
MRSPLPRGTLIPATSVLALLSAAMAFGQTTPSLNLSGATGLIDMPSGESQPDGFFTASSSKFGPVRRTTLSFQLSPRMSASFRYTGIDDWNRILPSSLSVYYDRSFDLRYRALDEGRYLPAVTVGFQDFIGTGLMSGEYIAATKHLSTGLKVTAGLGWGRLGSYNAIGTPFGSRPAVDFGLGGKPNVGQWFKGPVAAFGGVEWQANDKLTFKAEYSSDAYDLESTQRQTFERKTPFNFGVEYQPYDSMRVGAYYMYGSEVGLAVHFLMNPKQRPMGGIADSAPDPVKPRPSRAADPDAWSPEWVTQDGAAPVLMTNINKWLAKDGIVVEAIGYTGSTAQVRIRNNRYDAEAQAIGRVARAMTNTMPASVETFEIVPMVNGVAASKVTLRRSDIEALEFTPGADQAIRDRAVISNASGAGPELTFDPDTYPRLNWSLAPFVAVSLFDPSAPVRTELGIRLQGDYEIVPGLVLSGSLTKSLADNLNRTGDPSDSLLPHVRSDAGLFNRVDNVKLEHLKLSWSSHLGNDLYGRVTVGYLERMFGGASAELLWMPVNSRLALGAEVDYARQRDFDKPFAFQDYEIVTGHVSAYYELNSDYRAQLDVGRYLAGDTGATLSLDREFANGWRVGAFVTMTDATYEEFGEGSFDKGIRLRIPLTWAIGQPSRKIFGSTIRPLSRDGGTRLEGAGTFYESLRDYHASGLDSQWARFWK